MIRNAKVNNHMWLEIHFEYLLCVLIMEFTNLITESSFQPKSIITIKILSMLLVLILFSNSKDKFRNTQSLSCHVVEYVKVWIIDNQIYRNVKCIIECI